MEMEVDLRERRLGLILRFVVVVALLMHAGALVSAQFESCDFYGYGSATLWSNAQREAIGNLYTNWSGTPNLEKNLQGWQPINSSEDGIYTWWHDQCENFVASLWKGLECFEFNQYDVPGYMYNCTGTTYTTNFQISSLTLSNASITGPLPAAIGDLYPLRSLTLTGNPGLHGSIPKEIGKLIPTLTTLDLHNNNLSGALSGYSYASLSALQYLDFSGNRFIGNISDVLGSWLNSVSLRTFSVARNQLSGNFSYIDLSTGNLINDHSWFYYYNRLESADLSNNKITGSIPIFNLVYNPLLKYINMSGNQLTSESLESIAIRIYSTDNSYLQVLDLSNNLIHGVVDNLSPVIERLGLQLRELYLDGNIISGTLFLDEVLQRTVKRNSNFKILSLTKNNITAVQYNKNDTVYILQSIRIADNPFCTKTADICGADGFAARCFCYQNCEELTPCNQVGISKATILRIALSACMPFALLLLVGAFLLHRSRRQQRYLLLQVQRICEEHDVKPTIFTYNELRAATRDFHPDMKLGEGGYGAVYKEVLPNADVVAVKQLHIKSQQGMADFLNEVALISGIKHRNLVKLKGCCIREKQRLLVYEYVDNHDLDWNLLENRSFHILSWSERLSICLGIAHGLHYLHALAQPKIIYRDIKAANILLDSNLQPKIADFGLALLFPEETSHITTMHVAGTKGYLAPEYATLGQLSEKIDVYSFGVVCLEIVSGRRNIDNKLAAREVVLTNWIQKLDREGNVMDIVDSRLKSLNENELLEARRVIYTAMLCLQYSEAMRPPMVRVVSMLQGDLASIVVDPESAKAGHNSFDGSSSSFEISQLGLETIIEAENLRLNGGSSGSTF